MCEILELHILVDWVSLTLFTGSELKWDLFCRRHPLLLVLHHWLW